jgi:amino acid transporter
MTTLEGKRELTASTVTPIVQSLDSEEYIPKALPRFLKTRDMIALYILAVFWISNVKGVALGGAATFTYWLLVAVAFFLPCALVTAQLGVMFPYEGSIYNWTYKALGPFWSFFVGLCAWLPGVLLLVSAADIIVNCLQTLNSQWLVPVWQQGLAIICITLFAGFVSLQRAKTVQHLINMTACITGFVVLLIGLSAVIWLFKGHPSATSFAPSAWAINVDPQAGNLGLLGTVTLAMLGATMPLNMGGEISGETSREQRRIITGHLLWGTLLVIVGYFTVTFAVLVVEGPNAALQAANPIVLLVGTVDTVLGRAAGNITMICIMLFFLIVAIFEICVSARLLLVAGIDKRLPRNLGLLNRSRIPRNAIVLQTIVAVVFTLVIFFLVPYAVPSLGDPATLTTNAYTVTAASLLLLWAFSFIFPFADLAFLYFRHRRNASSREAFTRQLIYPFPLLAICIVVGPLVCAGAIVVTLLYTWIPTFITNSQWLALVGILTLILLVIFAVASMYITSQVERERLALKED